MVDYELPCSPSIRTFVKLGDAIAYLPEAEDHSFEDTALPISSLSSPCPNIPRIIPPYHTPAEARLETPP